jgi:hypothetical protein
MPIIGSFGAGSGRGFGQTGLLASAPVGLHSGGQGPVTALNTINRIELSTAGNATDFGDLTTTSYRSCLWTSRRHYKSHC